MSKVDISKATPRPWTTDMGNNVWSCVYKGTLIAEMAPGHDHEVEDANAELIVRAVNSHDAMLTSLKELLARDPGLWTPAIERARAAIRIAEGEGTP